MFEFLEPFFGAFTEYVGVLIILAISLVIAKIVNFIVKKLVLHITSKTKTILDDLLLKAISKPIFIGIFIAGIQVSLGTLSLLSTYMAEIAFGFTIIYAAFVGWFAVRIINAIVSWYTLEMAEKTKTKVDEQFLPIFKKVAYGVVGIIIILWLLGQLGVEVTTLIAAMGIGGLAVALALQDTLSEFFAGAHIILDRPIKIKDYIELDSGEKGYVEDIGWRSTRLRLLGNNLVIIPNSKLASSKLINYSAPHDELSVVIPMGVGYQSDLDKVEKVTIDVAKKIQQKVEGAVKEHKPFIRYKEFGDSNINFSVILRAKTYVNRYLLTHEFIKALKKRYDKEKIEIAWPVRKVYLHKGK